VDAPIWRAPAAACRKGHHRDTFEVPGRPERTLPAALEPTPADRLQAGRDALARRLEEALGHFKEALQDEVTPEALEGLAMVTEGAVADGLGQLAQALRAQGRTREANEVTTKFRKVWAKADVALR
jgi:hypothetical protein